MDTNPTPAPAESGGKAPERYIRTFANDMDIFQKGGTPGLAPLKPAPTPVESTPVPERAPLPIPEVVSAPPAPTMIQKPIPKPEQAPAERLIEASPIMERSIVVPRVPATEPAPLLPPLPPEQSEEPAPLETYAQDFRSRVKETRSSTLSVLAAEQDAAAVAPQIAVKPENRSRAVLVVGAGVVLLGVGAVGIYLTYSRYQTAIAPVILAPSVSTPIFVDEREQVSGAGASLVQSIKQSVAKPLKSDTVRLLSFSSASSSMSVFAAVANTAPGILLRNIDAMSSMAGVVNTPSGQSPFFILSVGSYSATFSGMLAWETMMQSNLSALFPLYAEPLPAVVPAPVATTTATTTKTSVKTAPKAATTIATTTAAVTRPAAGFRDEVVSNHDVRVYRDAQGRSILVYGYWDQTTLVIARDPAAFIEILGRLATSRS